VVVKPDTGIITDTALTPAAGPDNSDAMVGIDLLAGLGLRRLYVCS
jgi:hypothetical protein